MKYRVIQYRTLETIIEADSEQELQLKKQELADEDFKVIDWQESVEEA